MQRLQYGIRGSQVLDELASLLGLEDEVLMATP